MKTEEVQALLYAVASNRELVNRSIDVLKEMLIERFGEDDSAIINRVVNEWEGWLKSLKSAEESFTETIKAEVIARGESITGSPLSAIWVKGRHTWDGKGLAGYAVAHPEIRAFEKVGNPTCAIKDTSKTDKE